MTVVALSDGEPATSTATASASTSDGEPATSLTLGEVAGLAAVTTVAAVAVASLALAQLGRHDGWLAVGLGLALTLVIAAALLAGGRALGPRPMVTVDKVEIGLLVATAVAGALFFLPGFPYAYADKDPGIYVVHGFAIARGGDVAIDDVARERGLVSPYFSGEWVADRYPGDTAATSQFYHLPSALFATAHDLAGPRGLFNVTPGLAVLAVLLLVLAARRAANTWVAAVTGALLVTSMMQVWQAKMPSSEIPAQVFLSGALLAAVLAVERRWAGGAFVAGLLLDVGFLTRPDGFLYVLLAVAVLALAIARRQVDRRVDRRSGALVAGLAVALPYAVWNAYVARSHYSEVNSVPGPLLLLLAGAALVSGGWLVQAMSTRSSGTLDLAGLARRFQLPIGAAVTLVSAVVLTLFWYRGRLFGEGTEVTVFHDGPVPTYDERNLWWLVQYTTRPGLVIMWLGLAVLFLTRSPRSRPALFLLALPGTLLPLYLYDARISMRLMWWVRRFVPAVLPAIALLTAVALAWGLLHRSKPLKVAAGVATVWLVASLAAMSWPLRHHREMGGTWDIAHGISQTAGDRQGVFLFTEPTDIFDPMRNSPLAVWWIFDEIAAKLPPDYDVATVERYQEAFPSQPVYLVLQGGPLPPTLPADRFTQVREVVQPIRHWEESMLLRPDEPVVRPRGLVIWQLVDP
jgi:hypothetical protein